MLCLSKWLAKFYAWMTGKESTASCDLSLPKETEES